MYRPLPNREISPTRRHFSLVQIMPRRILRLPRLYPTTNMYYRNLNDKEAQVPVVAGIAITMLFVSAAARVKFCGGFSPSIEIVEYPKSQSSIGCIYCVSQVTS